MDRDAIPRANSYYAHAAETLNGDALRELQLVSTREILERAYRRSGFYRDLFDRARVKPEQLKTLDDIVRFPFIDKSELMDDQTQHPPFGRRVCVPAGEIRRVNLTSGTSGMGQEIHSHDEKSIEAANVSTAEHFAAIGLGPGDVSALLQPLGTMTGGMLSYEGLRLVGAVPLPLAIFSTTQKLDLMRRLSLHHIITSPAYLTRMTALCSEIGIAPREAFPSLKGITLSTESFSVAWAERMEAIWGTVLHDVYGSSQLNLNYAITCKYGAIPDGRFGAYHLADHLALVEVLDKETHAPVSYGEWGEPVVTTFSREAMPLIRFRSHDRVRLLPPGECACGRRSTAAWEVGTISRYDDMIKVKGVNLWPQTVDTAVFAFSEVEEYSGRVWIREDGHETISLKAEFKPTAGDEPSRRAILRALRDTLRETTQVTMDIDEVPHGTLPRFEYKARRWTDERITGLERVSYVERAAPTVKR